MAGCATASMKPSDFERSRPVFDPIAFFSGRTSSSGVMETRRGAPMRRVATETSGRLLGGVLHLEQDLEYGDGTRRHRSWQIRRIDAHRYEGKANDIIGVVHGEAYGNVFHWSFTLALSPGNRLKNVRMSQWMYLQPDGRTMINHTTIRKLGFLVGQVTEQFSRTADDDRLISLGRGSRLLRLDGGGERPARASSRSRW
ncbi:MAG: DUF3833 family protein [Vicinamibacterales bacterium]